MAVKASQYITAIWSAMVVASMCIYLRFENISNYVYTNSTPPCFVFASISSSHWLILLSSIGDYTGSKTKTKAHMRERLLFHLDHLLKLILFYDFHWMRSCLAVCVCFCYWWFSCSCNKRFQFHSVGSALSWIAEHFNRQHVCVLFWINRCY